MTKVLLVYASVEGHTRKVAQYVEAIVSDAGHEVTVVDGGIKGADLPMDGTEAVILAASVHRKRHPDPFEKLLKMHAPDLAQRPTLFLSVSLCAGFAEGQEEAQSYVDDTCARTGFSPDATHLVGGAIQLDKYQDYEAWVVRIIGLKMAHYEDVQEDRELTDWDAVKDTVTGFLSAT